MAATTLTDRTVVRLSGEDVRGFMQGLVTSDVAGPLPVWTALLTPQGKCLFDFLVWDDGEDLLIDCEAAAAADLVKRLSIYRLRRPIRIAVDEGLAAHWSRDEGRGVADPRLVALGFRWIAPVQGENESLGASSAPASRDNGWLAHRLSLGVCEGRVELGDLLWLECNAAELNGVSFTKGCFVGQENTARMNWRAKVNRRLVVVPATQAGPRTRVLFSELGLAVEHRRVDDLGEAMVPEWLAGPLAANVAAIVAG
jgi:hypothetical protein